MKHKILLIIPALIAAISVCLPNAIGIAYAYKNINTSGGNNIHTSGGKVTSPPGVLGICTSPTAQSDLDVNNVRARILTAGDYWWDHTTQLGRYEIPKNSGLYSIYAGALWIGGMDGTNLRVAGQTYGHSLGKNEFWPGPLDTLGTANVFSEDVCAEYDQIWKITRKEVENFVAGSAATPVILKWPGNGDKSKGQANYLAPFFDKDADGIYNPAIGDYPGYDLVKDDGYGDCLENNCIPLDQLYGDQTLFWIFNDKGNQNTHDQYGGAPIGLEIRAQAFGYTTDDEINNMTFYNFRIFNRSTYQLDKCYFAAWTDADLGLEYLDDYVGCDVEKGLGYTYNGDNNDIGGYEDKPPAVGIDFFRGPITNPAGVPGDGKDNDRDCEVDESCEQAIMSKFVYFSNQQGAQGDPNTAVEVYNYLSGKWSDGTPFTYGGTGYGGSVVCDFMFPGSSDKHDWGIGGNCSITPTLPPWEEVALPNDRRMVQSAGPFTLLPGAVNVITTGVVWAQAGSGGRLASVALLKYADIKAQALFDNCFKIIDGPDAPDVLIQEVDKKLVLYLSNSPTSNNYQENYPYVPGKEEIDPYITSGTDTVWKFQGYQIYQLKDATVSMTDLSNLDKARLVEVCDLKDGVTQIINFYIGQGATPNAWVSVEKVNAPDNGIKHSILVEKDLFATGTTSFLVNHKTYYFTAVAYGYNPGEIVLDPYLPTGFNIPYIAGRRNIKVYSAIPHIPMPETGGTEAHGSYGAGPVIKRIEGNGNGGRTLDFTTATVSNILSASDHRVKTPEYVAGGGPVNIKVVDPLNVPDEHNFTLKFDTVPIIAYNTLVGGFKIGEIVKGDTSAAQGVIVNNYIIDTTNGVLHIKNIVGTFKKGETIKGNTSGATAKSIPKTIDYSTWMLINNTTGDTIRSDKTIKVPDEQLILKWGLSVTIGQITEPGTSSSVNNGFLSATMTFPDPSKHWLSAIADGDLANYDNWIRSGTVTGQSSFENDNVGPDNKQVYEGVLEGTWAPFRLCAASDATLIPPGGVMDPSTTKYYTGPGFKPNAQMSDLASVDVVITSDKSKWSRCVVLELCEDGSYASNTTNGLITNKPRKFDFRRALSVNKYGSTATGADNNDFPTGMGWFPGYAVNLETGERLNIAFGENSALTTRPNERVISYNLRGTLVYTNLKNGPFQPGEKITDLTSDATATTFTVTGSNSMIVQSISGDISPSDIIVGQTSGAKAIISAFTSNDFQNGEKITGVTSLATATVTINNTNTSVMIINNVSGTFQEGEQISGGTSNAFAKLLSFSPYNFEQNGADMLWNPTSNKTGAAPWKAGASNPVFGGQHYIYVFGHNKDEDPPPSSSPMDTMNLPRYDKGKRMRELLGRNGGLPNENIEKKEVFSDGMWVNIPLLASGHNLLESDVTVRLRVGKSYKPGYSPAWIRNTVNSVLVTIYTDTASGALNKNLPMYEFSTEGIATHTGETNLAKEALDLIKVVPNPYYAFSAYETSQLDNRVKITNLPEVCTVSIYNLGGTLIRKFKKGETLTMHTPKGAGDPASWHDGSLDWDLKNTAGIPISSGVYIIHVEVPDAGEKVVKWFGVMRPIDLDAF